MSDSQCYKLVLFLTVVFLRIKIRFKINIAVNQTFLGSYTTFEGFAEHMLKTTLPTGCSMNMEINRPRQIKDVMQGKLFQKCTYLLYCSVLSLGGNVNTRRMSKPDMGSIFHIKKSMKYSGHRKLLCELSKCNAFNLLRY